MLRTRVHWQSEAPGALNIRRLDQERDSIRRGDTSADMRSAREKAAQDREARLAREDQEIVVTVLRRR